MFDILHFNKKVSLTVLRKTCVLINVNLTTKMTLRGHPIDSIYRANLSKLLKIIWRRLKMVDKKCMGFNKTVVNTMLEQIWL